jgi:hypothetical protein
LKETDPEIVLYLGGAPGEHLNKLAQSFSDVKFVVYDPRYTEIKQANVLFINKSFDDAECTKFKGKNLVLISDIRSEDDDEKEVVAKEESQCAWARLISPEAALFKFRLDPTEKKRVYVRGEVWPQVYSNVHNREVRIFSTRNDLSYDHEYNPALLYLKNQFFNNHLREQPNFEKEYAEYFSLNKQNQKVADAKKIETKKEVETISFPDIRDNTFYTRVVATKEGFVFDHNEYSDIIVKDLRKLKFVSSFAIVDDDEDNERKDKDIKMCKYEITTDNNNLFISDTCTHTVFNKMVHKIAQAQRRNKTQRFDVDKLIPTIASFVNGTIRGNESWNRAFLDDVPLMKLIMTELNKNAESLRPISRIMSMNGPVKCGTKSVATQNILGVLTKGKHLYLESVEAALHYAAVCKSTALTQDEELIVTELMNVKSEVTPCFIRCLEIHFYKLAETHNEAMCYNNPDRFLKLLDYVLLGHEFKRWEDSTWMDALIGIAQYSKNHKAKSSAILVLSVLAAYVATRTANDMYRRMDTERVYDTFTWMHAQFSDKFMSGRKIKFSTPFLSVDLGQAPTVNVPRLKKLKQSKPLSLPMQIIKHCTSSEVVENAPLEFDSERFFKYAPSKALELPKSNKIEEIVESVVSEVIQKPYQHYVTMTIPKIAQTTEVGPAYQYYTTCANTLAWCFGSGPSN